MQKTVKADPDKSLFRSAPDAAAPPAAGPPGAPGAPGPDGAPGGAPPGPPNTSSNRRLQQTQAQVEEVVDIMRVNVDKVLERDQKLSELDDRADALQAGASQFESCAAKLKNKYWWKNCKMMIMMGIIGVIVVGIIFCKPQQWQHHAGRTEKLVGVDEKVDGDKHLEILDHNLLKAAKDLRLGQSVGGFESSPKALSARSSQIFSCPGRNLPLIREQENERGQNEDLPEPPGFSPFTHIKPDSSVTCSTITAHDLLRDSKEVASIPILTSFSSDRETCGGSGKKTNKRENKIRIEEKLTDDTELNDLLGVEMTEIDGADVGSFIDDLQPSQTHGDVSLTEEQSSVHTGAIPLTNFPASPSVLQTPFQAHVWC
ncbi:hypothetical protein CCH79_00010925 [Gambusia affinis]|uniref:V-SNARE coiled-coil homology domain-containing protein n=1 Tax=Gambusia affinis TaxID=33528 RepID=A0A315VLC9_GAMAF|nr:hypothetical protein CCH79_00010925 [Gambusia affinis]